MASDVRKIEFRHPRAGLVAHLSFSSIDKRIYNVKELHKAIETRLDPKMFIPQNMEIPDFVLDLIT